MPGGSRPYGVTGTLDRPHGEAFYGTKGTIFSDRVGYEWYPGRGASGEPKSVAGADRTDLHVIDFIDCVRSRRNPSADVEVGHRSTIVAHLGNISYRIGGRKIRWNAATEEIIGDAEAAAMLSRKAREPWNLVG